MDIQQKVDGELACRTRTVHAVNDNCLLIIQSVYIDKQQTTKVITLDADTAPLVRDELLRCFPIKV